MMGAYDSRDQVMTDLNMAVCRVLDGWRVDFQQGQPNGGVTTIKLPEEIQPKRCQNGKELVGVTNHRGIILKAGVHGSRTHRGPLCAARRQF
jgi:hypothetical protein